MRNQDILVALVGVAVAVGLGLVVMHWRSGGDDAADVAAARQRAERVEGLGREVEDARKVEGNAVTGYRPHIEGDNTRLDAPAAEVVRHLPGVAHVEERVAVAKPTHRIIHFLDWHFVPRAQFGADLVDVLGLPLTPEEFDLHHRELCLQVELVAMEQTAALRCLVERHGLRRVLCAGLTPAGMAEFRKISADLASIKWELAALKKERARVKGPAPEFDARLAKVADGLRREMLPYGSCGRLAIEGASAVLPLDADDALQAAMPMRPDGTVGLEPWQLDARHAVEVMAALASGPVSVTVLGASHDLSAAVQELGGGTIEYLRVTMKAVERFAGSTAPR